jgi:hypothetical protein
MKRLVLCSLFLAACGDDDANLDGDASVPDAALPDAGPIEAPMSLADTGLWSDFAAEELADGVADYEVRFQLWSDGAAKRRWIFLPDGAQIDSSDMDFWEYPVGTKIWKEFTYGDTRVETRLLWKVEEDGDWIAMAYAWNDDQTEALAVRLGEENALDTGHDIPNFAQCGTCHRRQPDWVLGFTAIQLDHEEDGVNLGTLLDDDRLSDPPASVTPPYFEFEFAGDDPVAADALGYLHGNCGGCHNAQSDVLDSTPVEFRLEVAKLGGVEETPAYVTAVDQEEMADQGVLGAPVTAVIEPMDREASAVWVRMGARGDQSNIQMPPIATDEIDTVGRETVGLWIDEVVGPTK